MDECTILTLRERVDQEIEKSGETIVNRVVEQYVETERKRRADLIVAGVNALRQAEIDLKKVDKADQVHFNADGSVAAEHYTKGKLEEVKKARERRDRLTTALNAVLASHSPDSYKKLDETTKKGGGGKPGTAETSDE